jgi:protoheme IX farnesyltransferase
MDHAQHRVQHALKGGMLRDYWRVTKPGIVAGNVISAATGFLLASGRHADPWLLAATGGGIALVIASACVLNNCLERDLDRMMSRTRERAIARGSLSPRAAQWYAAALGVAGGAVLLERGNLLAAAIVLGGFAVYVGLYTLYFKRRSPWATAVGSLAGAAPPMAGYCAASGHFDLRAALLGLVFCLWQIPHFHAIAIRRLDDYRAAAIPVWPAVKGVASARRQMTGCIIGYLGAGQVLGIAAGAPACYAIGAAAALGWLHVAWRGSEAVDEALWARQAFVWSLVALAALSAAIALGALASHGK